MSKLQIKNLHVEVEGKEILKLYGISEKNISRYLNNQDFPKTSF